MKTFEKTKQDICSKVNELWNWTVNNKEYIIGVGIPTVLAIIAETRRVNDRLGTEYHRERFMWDPSSKVFIPLRRRLSKKEKVEFARRRKDGERVYDILNSMKLI